MTDVDLINEPISTKDYSIYNTSDLPKIFLGIRIKNKFDEARLKIKSKYRPRHVLHFKSYDELEPTFLYGVEIKPKKRFKPLLTYLNNGFISNAKYDFDEYRSRYIAMLDDYDLSCKTCYRYLSDGVYPLDVDQVDIISRSNYKREVQNSFGNMVTKSDTPWYVNLCNFNLFILTYSSTYNSSYTLHRN